jgi:hypothetical protein
MKRLALFLILSLTLSTVACSPLEQQARNTAAALQGAIGAAQAQYLTACKLDATQTPCVTINKAVAGQDALVTSVEAYCGWSTSAPPQFGSATCVPVKSAQDALKTAIANANQFISELKGVIK